MHVELLTLHGVNAACAALHTRFWSACFLEQQGTLVSEPARCVRQDQVLTVRQVISVRGVLWHGSVLCICSMGSMDTRLMYHFRTAVQPHAALQQLLQCGICPVPRQAARAGHAGVTIEVPLQAPTP